MARAAAAKKPEDPNKLKRERAGRYVTPDGRFAVEGNSTGSWYITDAERENELGLPLLQGPFATLDEARDEVVTIREGGGSPRPTAPTPPSVPPDAAATEVPAPDAPEPPATPVAPAKTDRPRRAEPKPAPSAAPDEPPEPAWLTRLAPDRRAEADRLLAVLERLGIDDPALVRRDIEANLPEVARALLVRRVRAGILAPWDDPGSAQAAVDAVAKDVRRPLRAAVESSAEGAGRALTGKGSADDAAALAWLVALRTAAAVFEAIDSEGPERRVTGEPGWRLLELDGHREPTSRAITIDLSDLLEAASE